MCDTCTITVIGDGVVGKTCLLLRYAENKTPRPEEYIPTVFENFSKEVNIDGRTVTLQLWDTAGQEDYDKLRVLAYDKSDVILLCYSVNNKASLENCKSKWIKELKMHKKVIVILVATKLDLATDVENERLIGEKMAKEIGAARHFMTSALRGDGVKKTITDAIRLHIKTSEKKCKIF